MSGRFARGLVVGKFSPLHQGHEYLLSTAQARCDELWCISYALPERLGCAAATRKSWLNELFPGVRHLVLDEAELAALRERFPTLPLLPHDDGPELAHRSFVAELCLQVLGGPVDAVFTSEMYGDGFAAELTRRFCAAGAAGTVEHVLVDLERKLVPISATALRSDRELLQRFVAPAVRASFVRRVCVLGGESTGKTTLTRQLAEAFRTAHAEEFGRDLWVERKGELRYDDYLVIGKTQVAWEERAARQAERMMFCDTSPLTTLLYCLDQFGRAEPELFALAERRYDLTLLCGLDVPFIQDGTRRDPAFRALQHGRYLQELERRGVSFVPITGSFEERFERARQAVGAP